MPTYNTANLLSFFSGASASDWLSYVSAASSNWISFWQAHFTIGTDFLTELNAVEQHFRDDFIDGCALAAASLSAGRSIDFSGMSIGATNHATQTTHYVVHTNMVMIWVPQPAVTISFWIEHAPN